MFQEWFKQETIGLMQKWLSMDWTPTVDYEGALEALTHEGIVSYLTK
jgi:hypothetical protein